MSWKNYFYFDRRDKNAILLLLVLIVVSILVYIYVHNHSVSSPIVYDEYSLKMDSVKSSKLAVGEVLDLNLSDTTTLKRVPGIGSSYAVRIVKYREQLGGYVNVDQLKEVWGIDDVLFEKIRPYFIVSGGPQKLRVNHSDYGDLIRHPYLNKDQVKIVLDLSKRKKSLTSIKRLYLLEEFTSQDIERLEPYLSFQ